VSRPVPASDEVINHVEAIHSCPDDGLEDRICPCGATVARMCSHCQRVLWMSTDTWCVHADQVLRDRRLPS
jgi:hypothetical protein